MTRRHFQTRCVLLCSAMVAGLSSLSVRLIQIQAWDRRHYADKARMTFERREILPGLRGKIVDRNEEVLAKSMPVGTVCVNVRHLTDPLVISYPLAYEAASAEPALPAVGAATCFTPSAFAMLTATAMPRALNEPVGRCDSSLIHNRRTPSRAASRGQSSSGVHGSPSDTIAAGSGIGSSSRQRHRSCGRRVSSSRDTAARTAARS